MGGAVSSGRDNDELVDNLMSGNYIRTETVERVFRVLDRADYMCAQARDQAYKDLAWRNGPLHLSAPCIYSEVMEALELKPGLSFLNVGSGTGYLSTLVGLVIGSSGISHGVEALPVVLEYANKKLAQFIENSIILDEFDFCIPKYYTGNGLCLAPTHRYDRVYCGAGVLNKYEDYFRQFVKVGGVLVMPLADTLVQLRRVSETHWVRKNLLNVSFARLRDPAGAELDHLLSLEEQSPAALQALSRAAIRSSLRAGVLARQPELRAPPAAPAPPPAPRSGPRRICIPYEANSDDELNELHDLDAEGGAHEMNALLSLVLSMGQNRAAGSLRFDHDYDPHADPNLGEREDEEGEPEPMSDDDIIVFDVGVRAAMRARRRVRPRPHHPDPSDGRDTDQSDPAADLSDPSAERSEPSDPSAERSDLTAGHSDPSAGNRDPDAERSDQNAERSNPSAERSDPRAERKDPSAERSDPSAERSDPSAERSDPSAELCESSSERSDPNAERGEPSGERSDVRGVDSQRRRRPSTDVSGQVDVESPTEPCAESSVAPTNSDTQGAGLRWSRGGRRARPAPAAPAPACCSDHSSSEDDLIQVKDNKRQKLDSGIGEGTASSGASPDKSPDKSDDKTSLAHSSNTDDDDADTDMPWAESECCSSGSDNMEDSEPEPPPRRPRARCSAHTHCMRLTRETARRRRARGSRRRGSEGAGAGAGAGEGEAGARAGADMRRVRLSLAMKRALKELPLPHALKTYLNYGRCYQI